MKCRDLWTQLPVIELFATRQIDPALRVKFAQRLLKLREAYRVIQEELQSLGRRFAKLDEQERPMYGEENAEGSRRILIEDVAEHEAAVKQLLDGPVDCVFTSFGEELLTKAKGYTPAEVASLIQVGLYVPPAETAPAPAEETE